MSLSTDSPSKSRVSGLSRRRFLQITSAGIGALGTSRKAEGSQHSVSAGLPFLHGVASGDPTPNALIIWTRVTPAPEALPGSGVGPDVAVLWEVALDESFRSVVASGKSIASAFSDHTLKIDVSGLSPNTEYFYRFKIGSLVSPTGRARTTLSPGMPIDSMRFGLVSCTNFEGGYFAAYRHLAERDDLDFILHVGDYIYEYGTGEFGPGPEIGRVVDPLHEILTLQDYRVRHGHYKQDPDLQQLHALYPFIVTWDDHEVADDAWRFGAGNHSPISEGNFLSRKAHAYQAYFEWMPIRLPQPNSQPNRIFRRFEFGELFDLFMLDLRQYRDQQASGPSDPEIWNPERTLTGAHQFAWLNNSLSNSQAQWKLIGNPVMITPLLIPEGTPAQTVRALQQMHGPSAMNPGLPVNVDQWDGYAADRLRLLHRIRENGIQNVVFLTGDIHSTWACEVPFSAALYPVTGESVAVELVVTSVTSDNVNDFIKREEDNPLSLLTESKLKDFNPYIKDIDLDAHGYAVVDVNPERIQADWYFLSDRTDPLASVRFAGAWRSTSGTSKLEQVSQPLAQHG